MIWSLGLKFSCPLPDRPAVARCLEFRRLVCAKIARISVSAFWRRIGFQRINSRATNRTLELTNTNCSGRVRLSKDSRPAPKAFASRCPTLNRRKSLECYAPSLYNPRRCRLTLKKRSSWRSRTFFFSTSSVTPSCRLTSSTPELVTSMRSFVCPSTSGKRKRLTES